MAQGIIKNSDIVASAGIETSKLALSVIDDVTTGGSTDVLSANMGKQLENNKVSVVEYQFHQMLLNSYFLNISWDSFIDQTLVDGANTTMTYDVSNDQYDFTAGQVLQSVDLFDSNTGMVEVTKCMISCNYTDSGTPTIEATADGINWEAVTLNQVHTFTNTGTVLKLRFTGSGAGSVDDWAFMYNPDTLETNYLTIPSARKQKDFYYEGILQDEDIVINAWYPDNSITIDKVTLNVRTPSVGGDITVDILKNGVEQTLISTLAASSSYQVTNITSTAFTASDRLGLIIKSVGAATTEGEGLIVTIHYYD